MYPNPPNVGILANIQAYLRQAGYPAFRYRQLMQSLQQGIQNFDDMVELPKPIRKNLSTRFGPTPLPLKIATSQASKQVEKVLFETQLGARIETVRSHYRAGWTSMCISSQAGCGLGCTFCATGAMGLMKNLTCDEICAQVFHPYWQKQLPDSIAFMGMGEALANPDVFMAIDTMIAKGHGGISPRRLTVSTVGHAPNLEQLTQKHPQVNITLSVHSPFPEQRAQLIPLERKFPLAENLTILDRHVMNHHRKVYLAYLLIDHVNDTTDHLNALIALVKRRCRPELFHVNVIRYNTAFGADPSYRQPEASKVSTFVEQLKAQGIHATRRTQFGEGIAAACGQLHAVTGSLISRQKAK
ncbi:23S rRNA m(2)A-2503 methyltransferase [Parapedobacter koreensis]|uniref:23S rRNA m(2)A-2503 methyltransferase n=2 Tax=Parapedobacter koreensis TaxID=332977 RepID=A0A1H7RDN8_9SPHI|nr:23S rRNA m(2)A-2503 methyltransferase [Parapedobacter koreensis]